MKLSSIRKSENLFRLRWNTDINLVRTIISIFTLFSENKNYSPAKYSVKNVKVYFAEKTGPRAEGNVLSGSGITDIRSKVFKSVAIVILMKKL